MAREGITYEQVAAAATALLGEGQQATIRAVREHIGTGSPNTVHRHLAAWRDTRPQVTTVAQSLSDSLTAAIAAEIDKAATKARAESADRLVQAQAENIELAIAGEVLENERDTLVEKITSLTTERDREAATALERTAEIKRQEQNLHRERCVAETALIEVAQNRNKLESQAEKISEQIQQIKQLRAQLEEQTKGRIDSEKLAAVTVAKLEAAEHRASTAEAAAKEYKTQAQQAQETAVLENRKAETKQNTIAGLTVKVEGLEDQIRQQAKELDNAKIEEKKHYKRPQNYAVKLPL